MDALAVVVMIIAGMWLFTMVTTENNKAKAEKRTADINRINENVKSIEGFTKTDYFFNQHRDYGLFIDNVHKKFCIVFSSSKKIYNYDELLGVELIENGTSLTKTLRGSQVKGAVIGGVLLGGAGAIIGGLSGKKETIKLIDNITLRLTLNDTKSSIFDFVFFRRTNKEEDPSSAISRAKRANSVLSGIITQNTNSNTKNENETLGTQNGQLSIADEILKLKSLRDEGIISNDEFDIQKNKLLV